MNQKISLIPLAALGFGLVVGCGQTESSTPISQSTNPLIATTASNSPSQNRVENSPLAQATPSSQITEGRYWMGGTDQVLEVQGDRYRYETEGGTEQWKALPDLKAVKKGVIYDGKTYWCLSTMMPENRASSCAQDGWVITQSGKSTSTPSPSSTTAEFRFFLKDGKEQDPRIVQSLRTACGSGALARVSMMPVLSSDEALIPDKVIELGADNNPVRRWGKPIDSSVLAIAGDRILVETDPNHRYWIDATGHFLLQTETTETLSLPKPQSTNDRLESEFPTGSGYYAQRFTDLDSGKERRMMYSAPCT